LAFAYGNSLGLALKNRCQSIAFPAVFYGVYGYPAAEAAKISVSLCKRKIYEKLDIYFYLFNRELADIWRMESGS
jgi:O-acetyl-ADP-ribose deacetylase